VSCHDAARDRGFTTKYQNAMSSRSSDKSTINNLQRTLNEERRARSSLESPTESGTQKQKTGRGQSGTGKNLIKSKM
jgi:hypothetical protein